MKKLKTAIIGQGRSGRDIHGAFFKSESNEYVDVAIVVEADAARRELALKEYPGCEVMEDYRELYSRKDIELVVNATYSNDHYSITKDLLSHGFNVVVEKPFARNYYECSDLIDTANKHGVMLAVFQQSFLAPYFLAAKKAMDTGLIGEVKQVSVFFNGFARRWDWQTTQVKMGGSVYNTGPHPIGIALAFLDFDDNFRVEYSKLERGLTSGDAEDYAKIILTAPGKPVVDVEISSLDAFCDFNIKMQGSRGTYKCTTADYRVKYIVDGENPERHVILESLKDENGMPAYCSEKLVTHEEEGKYSGTPFDVAVKDFYAMVNDNIRHGTPLKIRNEDVAKIISVIETVHAQNPMPKMI